MKITEFKGGIQETNYNSKYPMQYNLQNKQ